MRKYTGETDLGLATGSLKGFCFGCREPAVRHQRDDHQPCPLHLIAISLELQGAGGARASPGPRTHSAEAPSLHNAHWPTAEGVSLLKGAWGGLLATLCADRGALPHQM